MNASELKAPKLNARQRIPPWRLLLCTALLVTAGACLRSVVFEFAYDDLNQIVYNPGIQSWRLALEYFRTHVWAQTGGMAIYYRPIYMLWLAANHALFGEAPAYWHAGAVGLHLLCCLLLYFFSVRLTGDRWTAAVAVLLFGLHPAHVEAVAWVSGATESLVAALLFGALLGYWKFRESGHPAKHRWLALSLILATAAVFAKETAIVLPALIFSYEWIFCAKPRKQRAWDAARAAAPYALISTGYLAARWLALKRVMPPRTTEPIAAVLLAWPKVVIFYVSHLLFPHGMSVFYDPIRVTTAGFRNFVLPGLALAAGAALFYYGTRRSRVYAFLAAWCAVLLVPLLQVTLSYNVENVHDRYLYLPSAAYCIFVASLLSRLKEMHRGKTAVAILVVLSAAYAMLIREESQYWVNDSTLAQRGLEISPKHALAAQVMGNALAREGRAAEALPYLLDSLEGRPEDANTLTSLSVCYSEMGALPLAEEFARKAMGSDPSAPRPHLLLGIIRSNEGRLDEAEGEIRRAIQIQRLPESAMLLHYYLGDVLYRKGDLPGAVREFQLEAQYAPAIDPAALAAKARMEQIQRQSSATAH